MAVRTIAESASQVYIFVDDNDITILTGGYKGVFITERGHVKLGLL